MQYKGFKRMKRVAAVILSAAIVLTDMPGVSAAEYVQAPETEDMEETAQDAAAEEPVAEEAASESVDSSEETAAGDVKTEQQTETQQTEVNTENGTDTEQTISDIDVETQIPETEVKPSETETAGAEASETEVTETEEAETEASETELTQKPESVPVPDVDDSVYVFEKADSISIDNTAPFVSYKVNGTLEKNEQGEYAIDNKDQFMVFLTAAADYSESTVRLNCDVDMKGETAQFAKTFEGTFIGNGHSIYNFKTEGGLFRQIGSNGEVKGLHLSDVIFSKETASAALAAANSGKITNITVNADFRVTKDMTAAAGIVLQNAGTISDCVFAGTITADTATDNAGKAIGGIVSSNTGTVDNCHTLGSINTNAALIGGIVAQNYKTIRNCTNHMAITGAYGIGGIVAENTRTVTGCANYGAITQNRRSEEGLAGGIAAKNTDTISNCENYAKVLGEHKDIGGITGSSSGTVTGCGNYAAVSGAENTGGIVGVFEGTGDDENNIIKNSFNKGSIDVKSNSGSHNQGIGGIMGAASKNAVITIENCYNTAGINGASETKYLGGIAGVLYKGTIKNTYNTGTVSAAAMTDEFHPYAAVLAGFMGSEQDAVCTGCLFLEGSRDILYYRQDGAVRAENEKRTSAELKSSDALLVLGDGFALDNEGINDGYPVIKGQRAQAVKHIMMYEPNGGCVDSYFEAVADGSTASEPPSPMKKSASFLGWFTDKANTVPYRFSERVTKSMVLYAGWETGKLVEDMILEQTAVTLVRGEVFNLKNQVRLVPESAENTALVFQSGDPSVATVDDTGIVRAVSEGTANITVKMADGSLDKELTFKVTVSDKENIVRFKLFDDKNTAEITSISLSVNDPVTVEAIFGPDTPKTATVQWAASRPDYVKVTKRADTVGVNTAELEGLKPTAELDENGVDVMCTLIYPDQKTTFTGILRVTVKPLAESVSLQAGREDVTNKTVIYDIGTKKFIAVGDTKLSEPTDTLSASILPKAANQKVNWSSSNSYVIKFDDDEIGKANSSAIGEATITATAADGSKGKDGKPVAGKTTVKTRRIIQELSFTPKPTDGKGSISVDKNGRIEIAEGAKIKLVPTYNPADATERKIKWTIKENPNAIELTNVEEGTNILTVTAKKVAQDTIVKLRADTMDMGGAYSDIEFIIKPKVEKIKIFRTDDIKQEKNLSGNSIGIDPEKDNMTFSLRAVNEPDNASQMVTWKISNTNVADFKDNEDGTCTVKVKGMGSAVITASATDGSKTTATTMLNVNSLASNVEIEGSNMVMKGKTIKLKATVYPKSANNKNVRWMSLAPDYASVNESTGEVRGIQAGYALISATASDGSGASGTHVVWVRDPVKDFDIMEPDGDDNLKNDVLVTGKMIGLDPDNGVTTYKVAARILPETACQDVEWKSSNEKIATVEPVENKTGEAIITAKALGKATITATAVDGSGRKANVTVNIGTLVKSIKITGGHYLGVDQELKLNAEVQDKDATSKQVIWKSDNPRVATVEGGVVKAEGKDGDAIITAEAADGSGVKAEHRIYVVNKKNNVSISTYDNDYTIWTETSGSTKKKFINDIDLSDRETLVIRLRAELSDGSAVRDGVPMDINWSSSNKGIATVEPEEGSSSIGVITVHKAGTVRITATSAEGYESSDYVTLSIKNTNPFVRIQGSGHRLAFGKKMKLSTGSVAVDWYSDNEQVAKVSSKGQVTAGKDVTGTATITASALDGNHFDTYTIHVGERVQEVGIQMNGNQDVTGQKIGLDLMKGYKNNPIQLSALLDGVVSDDVTWKTSNKSIAEIDEDGYVDIKKNGNVTFTVTASDGSNKKAKVTLVVTKQITGMNPTGNIRDIEVGLKKSVQLGIDYTPLTSTMKKATWQSDAPSVVSVNKSSGKITGKAIGTAKITATAADNSDVKCEFYVTVRPAVDKVEVVKASTDETVYAYQDVIGIDLGTNANSVALKTNLLTKVGKVYEDIGYQRVSWSSSNKKIAEVDENGVVTGLKSGEVTITATTIDGSRKSGKVKIYVGKLVRSLTPSDNIKDGITLNLRSRKTTELAKEITVAPMTATNQTLVYTSSDKKIVTVTAKGKVTGKKAGEAVITVTPKDGSGVVLKIPVTVNR